MRNPGFHYVRKARAEGGVHAGDGPAPGQDLQALLVGGPPPIKVALEIIAAICEILYFAQEDGEIHGDVHPRNVVVASDGAVAVQGFGRKLRETWAPERRIAGPATDRYGLGYTAYRLLAEHDLDDRAVTAEAHEAAVVDAVVALPLADLPDAWARDIQYLIARLLDWDTDDRPDPYNVWLSFVAFANDAPGAGLSDWARAALQGDVGRRDLVAARVAARPEEALEGPVVRKAGLKPGAFTPAEPEARGEISTRFFTRDELMTALSAANDEPTDSRVDDPYAPRAHETTAFFTRAQWRDDEPGHAGAPRPVRSDRPPTLPPPPLDDDEVTEPGFDAPPPPRRGATPEPAGKAPSAAAPPAGATDADPPPRKRRKRPPEPAPRGGAIWMVLGCAVIGLVLGCAGISVIAALVAVLGTNPALPSGSGPGPAPAPTRPAPPPPVTPPSPAPPAAGPSPASDRPSRIVFTVPAAGTLSCDDTTTADLDGRGSVTFRKFPAGGIACTFKAGGKPVCAGKVGSNVRKCVCDGTTGQLGCS